MTRNTRKHKAIRKGVTHSRGKPKLELKKYDSAVAAEAAGFANAIENRSEKNMRKHKDNIEDLRAQGYREIERMDTQIEIDPRTTATKNFSENEVTSAMHAGLEEYRARYKRMSDDYLTDASTGTHAPEKVQNDATKMLIMLQKVMRKEGITVEDIVSGDGFNKLIPLSDEPVLLAEINRFTPQNSNALNEDVGAFYDFMIINLDQTKEYKPINAWALSSSYLIYSATLWGRK